MNLFHHPASTCAVIAGAVGGWTLSGVLSVIASLIAIVVGGLQLYDRLRHRKDKR